MSQEGMVQVQGTGCGLPLSPAIAARVSFGSHRVVHVDSQIYHFEDGWLLPSALLALSSSINKLCFCSPMYAFLFFPSFCRNRLCKVCIIKGNRYYLCNLKGKILAFI